MSVINQEYVNLQKELLEKQSGWQKEISAEINFINNAVKNKNIPLIEQLDVNVSIEKYREWILQLLQLLSTRHPALEEDMKKVEKMINDEIVARWAEEVLSFNDVYFCAIAREHGVSEWIPQFLAEHAIRPYLRQLAAVYQDIFTNTTDAGTCPCCGEPVRLARLEGKVGKKVLYCPRCNASWQEKRTKCSHCGKDHDEKMVYFHLENDPSQQLYICNNCHGYVKVIDAKERIQKEEPALLDLQTIHLDIMAQDYHTEKGY
ncbi:formate dehydrogenase accessory protein FdhE [Schinkia sp. CFF1]